MQKWKARILTVVSISLLAVCLLLFVWRISKILLTDSERNLQEISNQIADSFFRRITAELTELSLVSSYISSTYNGEPGEASMAYLDFAQANLPYRCLGIVYYSNQALYTTGENQLEPTTAAELFHLLQQKGWRSQYGDANAWISNAQQGESEMVYATPLVVNGQEIGAVFGIMSNITIGQILSISVFNANGYATLVDENGTPLIPPSHAGSIAASWTPDKGDYSEYMRGQLYPLICQAKATGDYKLYSLDQRRVVLSPLNLEGWYVATFVPTKVFEAGANTIVFMLVGSSLMLVLSTIVLCVMYQRKRRQADQALLCAAYTDDLTGLYNFKGFLAQMEAILKKTNKTYYIADCDVNGFAAYNSIFGAESCDLLLRCIADSARQTFKQNEPCARIYSDHFLCMYRAGGDQQAVERLKKVKNRFYKTMQDKQFSMSCGIYKIVDKTMPIREIIDCAIQANRSLKNQSGSCAAIYNEQLHQKRKRENMMAVQMEPALKRGEFKAYFQPKHSVESGRIVGAEALARWIPQDEAMIAPDQFIDLFEQKGLISQLDFYILETVCKQQKAWRDKGLCPVPVSVNFSRIHLHDANFIDQLQAILQEYALPPELIEVEFTESIIMRDSSAMDAAVKRLHRLGITVLMDDFGSGYSSLMVLKEIALDVVKLDKKFIDGVEENQRGKALVSGIVSITHSLDIPVVAEGVENKAQLEFLQKVGCEVAQGYYFAKPMPADAFEKLLVTLQRV